MGWHHSEDESEDDRMGIEEINAICDAAANGPPPKPDSNREGIDWIRNEDGDLRHPLQRRCFESAVKFHAQTDQLGWKSSRTRIWTSSFSNSKRPAPSSPEP